MMKNFKNNWNKPNDVGVIYNRKNQKKWENGHQITMWLKMS
jgi:hypothetical protein